MGSQLLQLAPTPRQCMTVEKFSFATSRDGYSGTPPWQHISGKDGSLFVIFDSINQSLSQSSSLAVSKPFRHRMRILHDPEVIEEFDLEDLGDEARMAKVAQKPGRNPTVFIVVQCPCIALRYMPDTNMVRKIQIRLSTFDEYFKMLEILSRANVPVSENSTMPWLRESSKRGVRTTNENRLAPIAAQTSCLNQAPVVTRNNAFNQRDQAAPRPFATIPTAYHKTNASTNSANLLSQQNITATQRRQSLQMPTPESSQSQTWTSSTATQIPHTPQINLYVPRQSMAIREPESTTVRLPAPRNLPFGPQQTTTKPVRKIYQSRSAANDDSTTEGPESSYGRTTVPPSSTAPARLSTTRQRLGSNEEPICPPFRCRDPSNSVEVQPRRLPNTEVITVARQGEAISNQRTRACNLSRIGFESTSKSHMAQVDSTSHQKGRNTEALCMEAADGAVNDKKALEARHKATAAVDPTASNQASSGNVAAEASCERSRPEATPKPPANSSKKMPSQQTKKQSPPSRQSRRIRHLAPVDFDPSIDSEPLKGKKFKRVDISQADRYDLRSSSVQPQLQPQPLSAPAATRAKVQKTKTITKPRKKKLPPAVQAPTPEPLTPLRSDELPKYLAIKAVSQPRCEPLFPGLVKMLPRVPMISGSSTVSPSDIVSDDLEPPPAKRRKKPNLPPSVKPAQNVAVVAKDRPGPVISHNAENAPTQNMFPTMASLESMKENLATFNDLPQDERANEFDRFIVDVIHDDGFLELCKTLDSLWQARMFRF